MFNLLKVICTRHLIFEICLLIITILSFSSTGVFKYDCNLSVDFDSGNNNNTWYSFNKEKIDEKKITSVCEKSKINVLDGLNMMINKQVVDKYISSIESATNNVTNPKLENIWNEFEVNMNKLREINEKMKQVENGACINKIVKKQLSSKRKPLETLITNTNNLLTAVKEIGVKWKDETTNMKQDLKSSGEKLKKLSLSLFASLNAILEKSDISCSSFNGNADEFCGITVQKTSTTYPIAYIFLILLFTILIISCIWLNFDLIQKRKKASTKKDEKPKEKKNIEKASRIEYKDQTGKTCFFPLTTEVLKQHEIYKAELKKEEKKQRREIKKMVAQPNIRMKSEYNAEDLEKLFGGRNEEPKKDEVLEKVVYEPSLNVLLNFDEDHVDIEPTSNHSQVYEVSDLEELIKLATNVLKLDKSLVLVNAPCTIVSDIHGQFADLIQIIFSFSKNGNVDLSDIKTGKFVFLGDYVDRGTFSVECICLLFSLKILFPTKFILLRGNHECKEINRQYGFD
ncbi:unnamed protein product [Caenorhabditis angaria]|uniref:Serine/threonine-protein phosphatase n=1 Tax=Caenorhabditis angaria TaxID=860376 RepID=A0A9P1IW91_9PELO|nr:unnamed protein product [Caenorhabditis angaria]